MFFGSVFGILVIETLALAYRPNLTLNNIHFDTLKKSVTGFEIYAPWLKQPPRTINWKPSASTCRLFLEFLMNFSLRPRARQAPRLVFRNWANSSVVCKLQLASQSKGDKVI